MDKRPVPTSSIVRRFHCIYYILNLFLVLGNSLIPSLCDQTPKENSILTLSSLTVFPLSVCEVSVSSFSNAATFLRLGERERQGRGRETGERERETGEGERETGEGERDRGGRERDRGGRERETGEGERDRGGRERDRGGGRDNISDV